MTDNNERGRGVDVVGETVTSPAEPTSGNGSSGGSTVETVKEQSAQVGQQAADTGQRVASVAKEEAQAVASEATDKARDLLGETKTQLRDQLSTQQGALATVLRSLADELHDMAEQSGSSRSSFAEVGETGSESSADGIAGQAVREVSARASHLASWLEQREPGDVLDEVTGFARRRPGLFLVLAGGAGLVAGRFTRGLTGASQEHSGVSADAGTQADTYPRDISAANRYPSAPPPVAALGTYPESTPYGATADEVVSGADTGSAWGTTHD